MVTILIVEDEVLAAMSIKIELERDGYRVCPIAANSERALTLFREGNPDVVLMDIHLSKKSDGIAVAREMKGIKPETAVIFMTGYDQDEVLTRARDERPAAVFIKPLDLPAVKDVIRTVRSG